MIKINSRFLAQKLFYGMGEKGQHLLEQSRVLIVGCGALGSTSAQLLARAGVGYLRLVDDDQVELANLHRQLLFDEQDADTAVLKVYAARKSLQNINSRVSIDIHDCRFNTDNLLDLTEGIDIIMDCSDNLPTRKLINQAAYRRHIPWVYGGVVGAAGLVKFVFSHQGEEVGDWFEQEAPANFTTCRNGVINTIPVIIASFQVTEAVKYLTGNHDKIRQNMIYLDIWENDYLEIGSNP